MNIALRCFITSMIIWFISGFALEYGMVNSLQSSGSADLTFYPITVIEKPTIK